MTDADRLQLATLPDLAALVCTLFGECRGEPVEGQVAVASVIRNRVLSQKWGRSYREVCLADRQFSCWNRADPNFAELWQMANALLHLPLETFDTHDGWRTCRWIAAGLLTNSFDSNVGSARHYLSKKLYETRPPSWATGITGLVRGTQVFLEGVA